MQTWQNVRWNYAGAKVLVTGGTSGIGRGIAEAYREAGADVIITGTRASPAEYDDDLSGFGFLRLDVENNDNIDAVAAAVPQLDILVNSGGIALFTQGLDEFEPAIFQRSLQIHLTAVFRMSRNCFAALTNSRLPGGGSILSIASMSSFFAFNETPAYGVAKTGLVSLTRQLAMRWGDQRVRVNAVAVGLTRSRASAGYMADPIASKPFLEGVPLGRHGEPKDIAGAALFLSSDAAAWITGQTLPVDGGFSIKG